MRILALDTTTEACSAALMSPQGVCERYQFAPREHANLILNMVGELLSEAELTISEIDALAVTRGPGSFTGVRIGISVAQGLAFGAGLPAHGISSLHAIAVHAHRETRAPRIMVALDARMGEVYCGGYSFESSNMGELLFEERVCPPQAIIADSDGWLAAGPGFSAYPELVEAFEPLNGESERFPRAGIVAALASARVESGVAGVSAAELEPVYLRDRVAAKPRTINSGAVRPKAPNAGT